MNDLGEDMNFNISMIKQSKERHISDISQPQVDNTFFMTLQIILIMLIHCLIPFIFILVGLHPPATFGVQPPSARE